ncbi:MAG: pseudouridine synthase, partial [Kiritimatiellaceae bacterium]|nr:pseudouridine synthase [Kiritimatiellaceae bacterium]
MIKDSFQVKPHEEGNTLLQVLSDHLRISKKQAKSMLDSKQVMINSKRIWMAKHKVSTRDLIETIRTEATDRRKIEILKKTGDLLFVNKPAGLVTNDNSKSLEVRLQREFDNPEICAVHRLDRETSGCVIFAQNAEAKAALIPLFKEQEVVKIYRAIVNG